MKVLLNSLCLAVCLFLVVPQTRAASCTSISGNLVANCGFDSGSFSSWTLSGNDVPTELNILYGVEGVDPLDGISPHGGADQAFFADLDANSTTLSQSIATTAGDMYTVSFWLAQDTAIVAPYSNEFSASFGGVSLTGLTAVPVEGYTLYSFTAGATSSSSLLSLNLGNDLGEFLLDDVSVTQVASTSAVPEPPAWTLALLGIVGCAFFRRRGMLTAL